MKSNKNELKGKQSKSGVRPTPEAQKIREHLDASKRKTDLWIAQQADVPLYTSGKRPRVAKKPVVPMSGFVRSGELFFYNFDHEIAARRAANIKRITLEYVASTIEWDPPADDKTWIDFAASAMEARITSDLSDLEFLISNGNRGAITALARLARTGTAKLSSLTAPNMQQLNEVACHYVNWPVLKGSSRLHSDDDGLIKQLGVGTRLPFDREMLPGLKKKAHKDAMRIAIELLCRLDDWRTRQDGVIYWNRPIVGTEAERGARQLEPFSVDTWPDWFELAWDILLQEHGRHPENNTELRRLGEYRKNHSEQQGAQTRTTPGTEASNVQDGIKERLKRMFQQLAPVISP